MKQNFVKKLFITSLVLYSCFSFSQEFRTFGLRYQDNIKGDLTFLANNILNRNAGGSNGPNTPYNTTGGSSQFNDFFNMQYIDIDGDPTTFSSSSANLTFPNADCNLIRYAGLYWSATYPSAQAGQAVGTGRQNDFNQVRFRVPGGSYINITADEVLYDGFTSTEAAMRQNSPYACYADVTSLVTALPNPTGEYTIANIRSVQGSLSPGGGASAGWTLVIVYENPTLSGKLITTFDGFARVRAANPTVDINYSGFNTIPVGPVRARIGVAALEGDNRIANVTASIRAQSNAGFTTLSNATNPANNFFNSTISLDGVLSTNRTPSSVNTLGYDTDIFLLNNPANSVIPNNETAATFRFTSNQDQYYPFFNSFNVEIIEPNIVVEKKVEDIAGNDITGAGVNLGQQLDYVLSFQNTGNDNAVNYTIRDILPINVTFIPSNLVLPPGVTYVFDAPSNTITFTIPNNLVETGDPVSSIRMRVRVAENCFDFVNACTDLIENIAFSTYRGQINDNLITDDPSVSDFDNCGFVTPGATNFLLDDLSDCDFSRTVQLCGANVLLDAGDNFDDYIWYRDVNENRVIDAGDLVLSDGNPDNDLSTLLVTEPGIYIVDKIVADPCKGFQEIITVIPFGATQINPIISLINDPTNTVEGEVVSCSVDGDQLPKIFLCGLNDTELIQINIPDAVSIIWQRLDENSCASSGDDCANKNNTCTWNQVSAGNSFLASDAGQYRLIINYQNGCFTRFYFNVFKNPLDPEFNKTDIICATPGNITVTNMPAAYEFQLLNAVNGTILVPYSANNGPSFPIATNGAYTVEMRQQGVVGGCIFRLEDIGVLRRDFQAQVTTRDSDCSGLGSISISILNVEPQYYYQIAQGGVTVDTHGPSLDNNYTFQNLNPGVYDILATTDDGCSYTQQVTIENTSNLNLSARVSQHISCREGNIQMSSTGGRTPHLYAIWSYVNEIGNPIISYPDVTSIPPSEFQGSAIFDISNPGDYTFVVVDRNNCISFSNTVNIEFVPAVTFTSNVANETCFGASNGSISLNITNSNGYQLTFFLINGSGVDIASNASGVFTGLPQGNYTIRINQRKGSAACDYFENYTITGPSSGVSANTVLIQDYTCTQNGIIQAQSAAGGTAPYTYSIDGINFGAPGANSFNNLTAGTYAITVRDASGCTFVTNAITLVPLNPPTDLTFSATAPNCPNQTSDVTVSVVNGNTPFTFSIVAPTATAASSTTGNIATFNGLAPNTYTFRVLDDKGCSYDETFTIAPLSPIDVVGQLISNVSCFNGADGEVLFNVSGFGSGSYNYSVTGPATFSGSNQTPSTIPLTGLSAGTYTIIVTDTVTNCTDTANVIIDSPAAALALGMTVTQPTCTINGNVQLTASNGWGGYTYEIIYPDGTTTFTNTNGSFTALSAPGNYTVSVEDANDCSLTDSFTINAAVAPVLEIIPNALCYTAVAGLTLTANVTAGGDGNYQYSLNGGTFTASNSFSGLTPGTHTVVVRDGNNCTDTESITIRPELTLTATASPIFACATSTNVTMTAAGGAGNYVYSIVADGEAPGAFTAANPRSVTGAGNYDVYVRDNNGNAGYCETRFDLTITQAAPILLTSTPTNIVCFGDSNGAISISATGGSGPYQYSIDNGLNYQLSGNFVNLSAGTYTIRVRDFNNCEETASTTIIQPDQIQAEAAITENYTCMQLGEIAVGSIAPTSGGSGNYQYSLNGGPWSTSTTGGEIYSDLTDGSYTIRVRDANAINCSLTLPTILITPLPTEPTLSSSISYLCDGSGVVTVFPDDPSYTYTLDGGVAQSTNVFNNVAPGSHTLTVSYSIDCLVTSSIILESGRAFEANFITSTDVSCNGLNDGTITFEVENFNTVTGFEYSIDGGTSWITSLTSPVTTASTFAVGNHTILVRKVDDPACQASINATIAQPTPVVASATITEQFTCNNTGAAITASATGGSPTYQYQLEDTVGGIISAYQNSTVFNNVPAGDYIVRARDINLCEDAIDTPITIVAPNNPTFTATPTACYSGNNDGNIVVDVTSIPGNGGFLFNINGGPWLAPTPTTATSYTFGNLSSGTYTINVRDQFGCLALAQTVTINPRLTANAVLNSDLTCLADAQVTLNTTGGSGTYTYEWSNNGGTTFFTTNFTGNVFNSSTDGTYLFRITDTTTPVACTLLTNSIVISPAVLPVISSIVPSNLSCNGDNSGALAITIDTSFGLAPFTINVLNTTTSVNYGTQTSGLPAGDYTVTVTDSKGCITTGTATIVEPAVITYTVTDVPITCDSASSVTNPGSITITGISGGTPEYTYYLTANNGIAPQIYVTTFGNRDHTFNILSFGIYQVDIVDANGCSAFSTQIIASPPDDLDIDVTTLTADCISGGTAIVQVGAAVGSGNYEFAILETFSPPYAATYISPDTPGGDTATFTGLTPGITYTFVVYDLTTNCYYFEEADAPINTPSNMTASLDAVANVSCTGSADGNISFTFDNYDVGATSVQYEIFNAQSNIATGHVGSSLVNPPAGPIIISNFATLAPGAYYLLLSEVGGAFNGCSVFGGEFIIRESVNLLDINLVVTQNDNCNLNAGIITATGQFGTAPYQYQILPAGSPAPTRLTWSGAAANVFNVESGDYDVYIKDANDCIQFDTITVGLDVRPEISLAIVDECVAEGTFQVLVTLDIAGSAPYQLSINGGPFQNITFNASNQYTVSGLSSNAGQTITVRDLNGCADSDPFAIQAPLQFNAALTTLLDCEIAPANNAEITINVTAGSGNYEYEISGPVNQARAALPSASYIWNLASLPGSYTITVYDTSTAVPNCLGSTVVEVPVAVVPIFAETYLDISCFGAADGSITLSQTDNGINPLTYSISPVAGTFNATTRTFENLPPDTYTITATGTNGCTTDITGIVINQPATIANINATVVEFGCTAGNNSNNASITIDGAAITGGSGSFVIYEFVNNGTATIVQSGANQTYVETNRVGGTYTINVYDDRGCVGTTTATILPFDEILTATAAITNPLSCTPGADGEITITTTSTNSDPTRFEYSIDNGVTYQVSNIFGGLGIGTYNFLVRHLDTGCITSTSASIVNPNTFDIIVNKLSDVICFGTNTGEVTFELVDAIYSGSINWIVWNTNGTASTADDTLVTNGTFATPGATAPINLFVGSYLVELIQNNFPGCSNVQAFTIDGPSAAITGNTEVTEITCVGNDGVIEIIDVTGGWGGYSYFVGSAAPLSAADFVVSPRFENLSPNTYEAWVMDINGCQELIQNTIVLVDPTPISASLQVNQENCTNLEGEIEVINTVGGQGSNYTYQLIKDGVAFGDPQTATIFTGLGSGNYEVQINDQWGCFFTTAAELLYEEMTLTATVVKLIDCSVAPGGEITINVIGGSANLEYTVTFPDLTTVTNATGIFTGLTQVGSYTFLVRDLDTTNPICEKTLVESLEDPSVTTLISPTVVDVSCNGLSDGSITVNLAPTAIGINEDPVYYYNLYDVTGTVLLAGPQIDPTFTGLPLGDYQVEAVSSRACVSVRQDVTITQPDPLVVTVTATPFICSPANGINTSTVTASVPSGAGTTPYLYSIDNINFQTGNTFEITDTGLDQTITVYVTDGQSCTLSDSVVILALNRFTALVTQDAPISCSGPEEVTIMVADNGNVANVYTFELLPVGNTNAVLTANPTYNSATFNLLAVGSYTFRITDTTTGCYFDTAVYTIAPYELVEVVATPTAPVICFGDTNGALQINVTGVVNGDYTYVVYNADGTPTTLTGNGNTSINPLNISGLSGGNYFVRVTEAGYPSCSEDSNIVTIVSPSTPLTTIITPIASVTCDNNRGELLVDPTGGYAPYDIVLTNTTTGQLYTVTDVQSFVFTGLSAGSFTIAITDTNGCVLPETAVLAPAVPIAAGISATPLLLNCFGDTSATVSATGVTGGEGVYQYQLNYYNVSGTAIESTSGAQTSPIFNNLGAGIYSISVSDGWNCDIETVQVTITEPTEVSASLIQLTALTCNTQAQIRLTTAGGTAPYEYSFNGGPYMAMSGGNTHTFNVTSGIYQYRVRDAFGCGEILSNQVSVDPVLPLSVAIDASAAILNCAGETTASIRATATGGLGNYQYTLYADAALTNLIAGPQTTRDFFNLGVGNYYVQVVSGDCVTVSNVIPVIEPTPLVVTDSFTNATCSGTADGTITINLSGGSGGYLYAISPNLNQFHTQNVFTGLAGSAAGITYTVIAQDVNGCFEVREYTIIEPAPIMATTTVLPEICAGSEDGSISLALSGGTGPYSTSLNSNNPTDFVQDQTLFTDLAAGTYVIFVRDSQGCETNVFAEIEPGVNLNATVTPVYECTGDAPLNSINVVLEDPSVASDVLYALDSTDPMDMVLEPSFTNIAAGNHYLAISHANGCTITIPFVIQGFDPLVLTLEQNNINEITAIATGGLQEYTFYFGAVNNGANNSFMINRTDTYIVTVVDENGCEATAQIFMEFIDIEIPNFFTPNGDGSNDLWRPRNQEAFPEILTIIFDRYGRELYRMGLNDPGWNGLYQNNELPTGDYWYIIKLNGANDDREFTGHFTLYR